MQINRTVFRDDHEMFRTTVRRFLERECVPHQAAWDKAGCVDRETWLKAGREGLLGITLPTEYGGGGGDFGHSVVFNEEVARSGVSGLGFTVHSDIIAPYIARVGNEAQKRKWIPDTCSGKSILAIAMTEPGTGSDLKAVRTTAVRDGDDYVINGSKTFISNGLSADLIIVVCKTDPTAGAKGISLIMVEADRVGFRRGRKLEKIGQYAQDTAELFFDDVRVPVDNLLGGEEGQGFAQLMQQLPQERLLIGIGTVALMFRALQETTDYVRQREVFGKPLLAQQNTRFKLAECATQATIARSFVDDCVARLQRGELDVPTAAMVKWWTTDAYGKLVDECLQFFGGYGYMNEYPIARMYADARVGRIYGGANEVMKEIIARAIERD